MIILTLSGIALAGLLAKEPGVHLYYRICVYDFDTARKAVGFEPTTFAQDASSRWATPIAISERYFDTLTHSTSG
jgi:hypothetical protein